MLVAVRKLSPILLALALSACSRSSSNSNPEVREPRPAPAPAPTAAAPLQPVQPDGRKVLVVFGDSIAAGYGLDPGESFPDDLQKKLDAHGYPWRVVNLGISGDTTEGGVARTNSATALKPGIVILELGGNDGLRGLPLKVTRANLEAMILAFQGAGARVVLAGMTLPPNYGAEYISGFEKVYKELAAAHHLTFIPFLLSDMLTKDLRYLQRDGIHPTAEGAEIVSETVMRAIKPSLGPPQR